MPCSSGSSLSSDLAKHNRGSIPHRDRDKNTATANIISIYYLQQQIVTMYECAQLLVTYCTARNL
eukprot:scaffold255177_cov19-Prasinocladus_malaysianus.AAC.3